MLEEIRLQRCAWNNHSYLYVSFFGDLDLVLRFLLVYLLYMQNILTTLIPTYVEIATAISDIVVFGKNLTKVCIPQYLKKELLSEVFLPQGRCNICDKHGSQGLVWQAPAHRRKTSS